MLTFFILPLLGQKFCLGDHLRGSISCNMAEREEKSKYSV